MMKNVIVRNSTAEFLTFIAERKEEGIQVLYKNESIWATQKAMSMLFDCSSDNIGLHLKNIFKSGELEEGSVTEKISATAADGKMYMTKFYNLDAIISVGYRVNSIRATQFRQWCTSERRFYQKLTDIYATAVDYNRDAPTTRLFYKKVQNKIHFAVHGQTTAELIVERADAGKEHMGLTTGRMLRMERLFSIAKNYLNGVELEDMGKLVNSVLDMAERMADRHIPMTMEDWAKRIDIILEAGGDAILNDAGKITAEFAKSFAES